MQRQTLANLIERHMATQQAVGTLPTQQTDQINAAALDGARSVDAASAAARQAGVLTRGSVTSGRMIEQLAARYGDPFTELDDCCHLEARPIQPRYIYGAAPRRAFCRECLAAFLLASGEEIRLYDASTNCDACGANTSTEDLRVGNLSNGLVTYILTICSPCAAVHP